MPEETATSAETAPLLPVEAGPPPVISAAAAERLEVLGILTCVSFLLAAPFHWWAEWNLAASPALARLDAYAAYVAALLVVLGAVLGGYTLVRAWPILRDAGRPMAHRLAAGYGFSYAAFALLVVGSVLAYLALSR